MRLPDGALELFAGNSSERHALTRQLTLTLICIVYFAAFCSMAVQVVGLVGADGILPARELLEALRNQLGWERYWQLPSVFWLADSDTALVAGCVIGAALSLLPIAGVAPRLCLFALWALYLSLASIGGVFLGYQWDALLLEAGLLSIFFAPAGWLPAHTRHAPVSRIGLWLMRWLLLRLMLLSGLVKLSSGDETWRDGSALAFHYFTQPLPTWTSYYAHQLPPLVHNVAGYATLAIEIAAPLAIFAPRRLRTIGFALLAGLQLAIAATGNYGFFNLLTLALCVTLLADDQLLRALPTSWRERVAAAFREADEVGRPAPVRRLLAGTLAALLFALSGQISLEALGISPPTASIFAPIEALVTPLRSVNAYGLFAVMTTTRPEIVIEGSRDGREWQAYEFEWKPGATGRRPQFSGLHMPRLDWQLWFAALRGCDRAPWFHRFLERLLEGSPAVSGLLRRDPFAGRPPRYVRSNVFSYEFDTSETTQNWWTRRPQSPYCATVTLASDGRLLRANLPTQPIPE